MGRRYLAKFANCSRAFEGSHIWRIQLYIYDYFQMLGAVFENLAWYRRTKDLVPLFDLKVYLFENSLHQLRVK